MKAFLISIAVLVIVASGAAVVLDTLRQSSKMVYTTQNVRLD